MHHQDSFMPNDKLGKLSAAAELYESALAMQPNELWIGDTQQTAQAEARSELEALSKRIPTVKFEISGGAPSPVEVTVDGNKLENSALGAPKALDPGQHFISAVKSGRTLSASVTLAEGESKTVPLRFDEPGTAGGAVPAGTTPDASKPSPGATTSPPTGAPARSSNQAMNIATWSALGVGAAGLAFGTVAGVVALRKHSDLIDAGCSKTECHDVSLQSSMDSYRTWRTVSMVSYIVGAVGTAAGVTLLLVKPKQEPSPTVSVVLAPGALVAGGRF
jgi:hypothetical protein